MKKFITLILSLTFVLALVGCGNTDVIGTELLKEGEVKKVVVTSLPEGYDYSFTENDAKEVCDYLSGLNLETDFKENPNEYTGMTWVVSIEYENNETLTIYHFGNMFIRTENSSWYKMSYEQASQFDSLLNELNN